MKIFLRYPLGLHVDSVRNAHYLKEFFPYVALTISKGPWRKNLRFDALYGRLLEAYDPEEIIVVYEVTSIALNEFYSATRTLMPYKQSMLAVDLSCSKSTLQASYTEFVAGMGGLNPILIGDSERLADFTVGETTLQIMKSMVDTNGSSDNDVFARYVPNEKFVSIAGSGKVFYVAS